MSPAAALNSLSPLVPVARRLGATGMYLYGSASRGEETPASDLDIFVDVDRERFGFVELIRLKEAAERIVGRRVDLTTREGLHPALRDDIERAAVRVF